jgi:tellurite methyltransferase
MDEEKYFFEREVFSKNYEFRFPVDEDLLNTILSLKKKGKILDIGIGDSGTTLKLAKLGFDVTCVDISPTCIKALKEKLKKENINMKAICCDIENFKWKENYDIIIATGVLHFLSKETIRDFLNKMKMHTKKNGLNVIEVFLKGSACEKDSDGYYFSKNEILKIYRGWEIIEHEIYKDEDGNLYEFLILKKLN